MGEEEDPTPEIEQNDNAKDEVKEPEVGMTFDSIEEVVEFYRKYAKGKGFGMSKRSSRKVGGELRYVTIACSFSGKPRTRGFKVCQLHPQTKTACKAKITAVRLADGKWKLGSLFLDHNHEISPGKSRFYKCHRVLNANVKRKLLVNNKAGVRTNKSYNSLVVEGGGYDKLEFTEKDCRNFLYRMRRLELGEGDAVAMENYFLRMKQDNPDFFHIMDLSEEGRLRNVFWADARSRAAFKEFGDVITFDTTYLVNKYAMPFAPFVGVNHHGQSILLGCGLISNEDTATFKWLFQSWLTCMYGTHPHAIITDQDGAMKNAIADVFPNTRHRWCLWHIMKKLPEKLGSYKEYKAIKYCVKNAVYDSLTKEEFEDNWKKFIKKYGLESNEWLLTMYEERHRWIPAFVKDAFWAGMSTTQRSESMNAFFDGFVNSKTTLKEFVEQYENALAKKAENEKSEDTNSINSFIPCITPYTMEKQFQCAYTRNKFKEFQMELMGKIACDLGSCKRSFGILEYEVKEDIFFGDECQYKRCAPFKVSIDEETGDSKCNCRLFEFKGLLCRHQIVVFIHRKVNEVPDKYILDRWNKNVKRSHTKVRISYDNWAEKPQARRFDKMTNAFFEVADMASEFEDISEKVMDGVHKLKLLVKEEISGKEKKDVNSQNCSTSKGDGTGILKESTNVSDPLVACAKGRPVIKRKQSTVEKVVKKTKKGRTQTAAKGKGQQKSSEDVLSMASPMGSFGLGTQESINLTPMTQKQTDTMNPLIGTLGIDAKENISAPMQSITYHGGGGVIRPNIVPYPLGMGIRPCFGQHNMVAYPNIHVPNTLPLQGLNHPPWRASYEMATANPTSSTKMSRMNGLIPSSDANLRDSK